MAECVHVFLCGERHRGDDAAALDLASLLAPATSGLARLREVGRLEVEHLLDLPQGARCIVVDAVAGLAPGALVVAPLHELEMLAGLRAGRRNPSSHTLPMEEVFALAASLRAERLPGTFIGIGGERFDLGAPLSPAVAAALPLLGSAVVGEILRLGAMEAV